MSTKWRYPWWVGPVSWLGSIAIRAMGLTWRIERRGLDPSAGPLEAHGRCIFVFWHSRLVPLVYTHRGRGGAVLSSRHLDGEISARMLHHLGYVLGRGSSTRAGEQALRRMVGFADHARFLALTPDGPHGPVEVAKVGAVFIASRTGLPVIPVATSSSDSFALKSWDRMRLPRPFARVVVQFAPALHVPPGIADEELERWRLRIEAELKTLTAALRAELKEPS